MLPSPRAGRLTTKIIPSRHWPWSAFAPTKLAYQACNRAPEEAVVLGLARRRRLSVYDASYLELARREGIPLATLDVALSNAASTEAVPLMAP
jgi:predicted nucleic acid-binding protein